MNIDERIRKNTAAKFRMAVIFGILAGVIYSGVAWGVDGYRLAQANAILPYLPFTIGAVICALVGALAGFLTYRFNHIFLSFVIWVITGLVFAWVGNHMQVNLIPLGLDVFSPQLAAQASFPFNVTIQADQFLISIAVIGLCALGGMLSVNQIEAAVDSAGIVPRILALLIWAVIFTLAGFAVRDNLSEPMAAPVVNANAHIQVALDNAGKQLDERTAAQLRLSAFDNIRDLITRPRRLALIGYDDWLSTMTVLVDFGGTPVRCTVYGKTINFCERE